MTWWFYGCSYTAGHEIHDAAVKDEDGTLHWLIKPEDVLERNKQDSWAGTLCKLQNVELCNRAEYGSSSGQMMVKFLSDIQQNKIDRQDIVIWASTFSRRWFDIQDKKSKSWVPRNLEWWGGSSQDHLLETWSDTHLLYRWFQDLYQFVTICHHEGYECMIIPCGDPVQMELELLTEKIGIKNENLLKISEYITSRIKTKIVLFEDMKSFSTYTGDLMDADGGQEFASNWYEPGGHPTKKAHDLWAERIYQSLNE